METFPLKIFILLTSGVTFLIFLIAYFKTKNKTYIVGIYGLVLVLLMTTLIFSDFNFIK